MFLEVKNLKKYYGDGDSQICVLNGVDFSVGKGELVVILGPSGSGKSTVLNLIGGLETADDGKIIVDGKSVTNENKDSVAKYRRDTLGFIFQSYNLIPNLTVKENIEICWKIGDKSLDIDEVIEFLGLTAHKNKFPRHLSGGQQQRTAIARAIVKNPKLLLCDEPTGALDYETSKDTLKLIDRVKKRYGTTVLIVTHNEAIGKMADRIIRVRGGEIISNKEVENPLSVDEIEW
ncbi:MAG: ABC transporter ATP-binding protein [Lachnospiraceae bacterium]|nr:ABC transporter ATP-binding protein [Lachnospiraceae bacterium]